jgi:4,5-DOPA dioxygenase extradiol
VAAGAAERSEVVRSEVVRAGGARVAESRSRGVAESRSRGVAARRPGRRGGQARARGRESAARASALAPASWVATTRTRAVGCSKSALVVQLVVVLVTLLAARLVAQAAAAVVQQQPGEQLRCSHSEECHSTMRAPVIFIGHGGGPFFLLRGGFRFGDADSTAARELRAAWRSSRLFGPGSQRAPPTAVLVVSAHWESSRAGQVEVLSGPARPGLLYDYYGFPPEAYQLELPVANDAALNGRILQALSKAGVKAQLSPARGEEGYDHGVFIPLLAMGVPQSLPVAQVSLDRSLSAAQHLRLGQALSALRDEGVLLIGSGMLTHNMGERAPQRAETDAAPWALAFQDWVDSAVANQPDAAARARAIEHWDTLAPGARHAHPREEHLLPFFVCCGAAWGDGAPHKLFQTWMAGTFSLNFYTFG